MLYTLRRRRHRAPEVPARCQAGTGHVNPSPDGLAGLGSGATARMAETPLPCGLAASVVAPSEVLVPETPCRRFRRYRPHRLGRSLPVPRRLPAGGLAWTVPAADPPASSGSAQLPASSDRHHVPDAHKQHSLARTSRHSDRLVGNSLVGPGQLRAALHPCSRTIASKWPASTSNPKPGVSGRRIHPSSTA